ncbi:MAG: thiamine diphosphokinase [Lachnospiraceae bacterium]|nr:thiamine diphosphokinase [Lachnospiraceae bacterium]
MRIHTVIVSGGNIQEDFALFFLKRNTYDRLIGVDKGLEFLYRHQILPTHIVGDFDSVDTEVISWYREHNTEIEIRTFDPVKDSTDTQIAVELALELGSTEITILGGMGSRLDHTIGNVQTMALAMKAGVPCALLDAQNRVRLIREPLTIKKEEQYGRYVSLLPLTTTVEEVSLKGFKYPLTNHTFTSTESAGLGVSNEIVDREAHITFSQGVLMLIESRD